VIEIGIVLGWLNWENPTEISDSSRFWIGRAADNSLSVEEKKTIIQNLANSLGRLPNPLEQAEILVYCSTFGYQLGMFNEAESWIELAADLYEYSHDSHRFAIALWLLFIIQHGRGQFRKAYGFARRSRNIMIDQANERLMKKRIAEESWYRGRILDITFDLVSSPEDMFECLFEFQGSNLFFSAAEIKSRIASQMELKDFSKIDQEIQLLLGITLHSLVPGETGEALAFCGVVSWVLENKSDARNFFRSAMTQYLPGTFHYAVVQWMFGLALFTNPVNYAHAISVMEKSIHDFDQLREKAIHENKMDRREWFATYNSAMKRVLRTRVGSI
jgi:hypothetical protein